MAGDKKAITVIDLWNGLTSHGYQNAALGLLQDWFSILSTCAGDEIANENGLNAHGREVAMQMLGDSDGTSLKAMMDFFENRPDWFREAAMRRIVELYVPEEEGFDEE